MRYFLAKTEPGTYSIDDLERDGSTTWDGVTNPQAVRAIREMKPGESCLHLSQRRSLSHCRAGESEE